MKKRLLYTTIPALLIVLGVLGYFFFIRPNGELLKAAKSLNAQNWDMAIGRLKEIIYDDENNQEAKGLLLYAQTRKYFEEHRIKTFRQVNQNIYTNLLTIQKLFFQNKLNESGFLNAAEKEQFMNTSKDLRKQLAQAGISTDNMNDVEKIFKNACKIGVEYLKISGGDEIDQAIYAYLLAGNSFFGDRESGKNLLKLAKINEDVQPLFLLCGNEFANALKEEAKNDQSLLNNFAKFIVIRNLLKDEVVSLFERNNKFQSAYYNLKDQGSYNYNRFNLSFKNNEIFFDNDLFPEYQKFLENNKKAGIDVEIMLSDNANVVILYAFDPVSKKYYSKFYTFADNSLMPLEFRASKGSRNEFYSSQYPVRIYEYNKDTRKVVLAFDQEVTRTTTRMESVYNDHKYYSPSSGFYGGYEYVEKPYQYKEIESTYESYQVNKNNASFVSTAKDPYELK